MSLISELNRRNVFRAGVAYLVLGWLLLQIADVVVPILALPDWVAKLVLFLLALGFPLVLFFAWAFELTPEGIKRERDIEPGQSITRQTGRKLDRAIILVLLIAVGWFAWDRFATDDRSVEPPAPAESAAGVDGAPAGGDSPVPVVAVLPFKATGSEDGGFLAAGLHDDLLTRLAKLAAYRVISRTSMMEYAGTTKNMRQIGQELGADYILEGGVQARGERIRINAQLIDAPADEHIWAEVYNRNLTASDLFDVQAELAVAIAAAMQTTLSPADEALMDQVPTENTAAYNAYLRGIRLMNAPDGYVGTQADRDAVAAFEEAVALDPDFALAWALLARARVWAWCCEYRPEHSEAALAALARARALQPGLLESELAWAEYLYRFLNEYAQALATLEALGGRLESHPEALQLAAFLNRRLGRIEAGYGFLQAALKLEPRNAGIHLQLARFAWLKDDCDAAGRHIEAMRSLAPDAPGSRVAAAEYELACTGNAQRAADLIRDLDFSREGGWLAAFEAALLAGDAQLALTLIDAEPSPDAHQPIWDELRRVDVYRFIAPDDALADRALDRAGELLQAQRDDVALAESEQFAAQQIEYHGFRGDAEGTPRWIQEHRQRHRARSKGDVLQEANNRFYYAQFLTHAGLHDEAVEELRVMLEEPGGRRFPVIEGHPAFDALRNHPAYVALQERFSR